jgi:hypothetical protein
VLLSSTLPPQFPHNQHSGIDIVFDKLSEIALPCCTK